MESPLPAAIIYLRKLKPLSVSFPAPGVYQGQILIVLSDGRPDFLSRLGDTGSSPPVLEFFVESPISARDILDLIREEIGNIETILDSIAVPFNQHIARHLELSVRDGKRFKKARLIPLDNPLESPQD